MQGRLPVKMDGPPMPPIQLDHIAIALPCSRRLRPPWSPCGAVCPTKTRPSGAFRRATGPFAAGATIKVLEPQGPDGFPAGHAGSAIAVRILGLRLRAQSRPRAMSIPSLDAAGAALDIRLLPHSA